MTEQPDGNEPMGADAEVTGGSAASRAYRKELARQGLPVDTVLPTSLADPTPAKPAVAPVGGEARAAERKKVTGRARIRTATGETVMGKMVDISLAGACVMLDDMFASNRTYVLEYDIFHGGTRYVFSTQAVSVYGVLARGKGFKVGFRFMALNETARKCIGALVA